MSTAQGHERPSKCCQVDGSSPSLAQLQGSKGIGQTAMLNTQLTIVCAAKELPKLSSFPFPQDAKGAEAVLEAGRLGGFINVNQINEFVEELPGTKGPQRDVRRPKVPRLDYSREETLAYAAARLPACYAVSHRVFQELRVRSPGFVPTSILDFGSGPGTAIWAAQEVRPGHLLTTIYYIT
jgi:hypothetical protein